MNVDYDALEAWESKWRGCRKSWANRGPSHSNLHPGKDFADSRKDIPGIAQFVVNIITDLSICGGMLYTLLKAKKDVGNPA